MLRVLLLLLLLFASSHHHDHVVWGWQSLFPPKSASFSSPRGSGRRRRHRPVALITGATGQTGQIVTKLLLDQGFGIRVFARSASKAREILTPNNKKKNNNDSNNIDIQFCEGDLGDATDIQAAFDFGGDDDQKITHVVYCAGGEDADYNAVSYRGVMECAKQVAKRRDTIQNMVVISTAWATKPYSIAGLLFNTLYNDSIPMACYYLGERELRKQAEEADFNYVILRPGGLNSDENYKRKYPEASKDLRLTYQQGDAFEFLGPAGRPGMCRTQLANAVVAAMNVQGRYTVEVTGSGTVDMDDTSVYETSTALLAQDNKEENHNNSNNGRRLTNNDILRIHSQAVEGLKIVAIAASVGGIALIAVFGWISGIALLLALDASIIILWSQLLANRQVT